MKAVKLAVAALALGLMATPVAAQLGGQPVYAIPKGVGLGLNADFGFGIDPSGGNALAARATLGLPMIKFTVAVQPEALDAVEMGVMGGAAVQLMPMPVSVRLQATAGYGIDSETFTVAPGVVIGLNVPSPALSVEPWVMPSLRYVSVSGGGSSSNIGVSAGVNLGLPGGLGGHAALDVTRSGGANFIGGGIGVHYQLSVPGLGGM